MRGVIWMLAAAILLLGVGLWTGKVRIVRLPPEEPKALALSFLAQLKDGNPKAAALTMHPKLVESIGEGHLAEIARKVSTRIQSFVIDDAKTEANEPTYYFHGRETFTDRPAGSVAVRVQRVEGKLWVTKFELE